MRHHVRYTATIALVTGLSMGIGLSTSGPAFAAEIPPEVAAASVLGATEQGINYKVLSPVASDGLMRIYRMETPYGLFVVHGDAMLKIRIRELAAVNTLQTMARSDTFAKSLGQAAAAPLRYGADLVTAPKETLKNSVSGISNMFDRIGAGARNREASRDTVAGSLMGIDGARRNLAVQLGVDPYSTFPPLATQLEEVARAAGLGGLTVQALMMAIPGGAGVAVSSASSVNNFSQTLKDKTSSQIVDIVTTSLQKLGVSAATTTRLVRNRFYSPAGLLLMSSSLSTLNAKRTAIFVDHAADVQSDDEAFFQVQRAVAIARNAKGLGGVASFADVGGVPLNRLADGRLIAIFPFDEFVWTDRVAALVANIQSARPKDATVALFATNATPTPVAMRELKALGWTHQPLSAQ